MSEKSLLDDEAVARFICSLRHDENAQMNFYPMRSFLFWTDEIRFELPGSVYETIQDALIARSLLFHMPQAQIDANRYVIDSVDPWRERWRMFTGKFPDWPGVLRTHLTPDQIRRFQRFCRTQEEQLY